VEIWRGLETIPLEQRVTSSAGEQTFRLHRWINTGEEGYMNGDTHVHYLTLDQCHLQMRAEDLEVLNLLTSDFTNDRRSSRGSWPRSRRRAIGCGWARSFATGSRAI
jgi:hypothetical protein